MPAASFHELPDRGPGIKAAASASHWGTLEKDAVATIHTEPDACDDCKPLDGDTMRMGEAEDLLPKHPNCRCWYTWDWRPELRDLSVTSLLRRASEPQDTIMTDDTFTVTKHATAESVVEKTPNGESGGEYLKVPVSSTNKDRDGDSFSEDGLQNLKEQVAKVSRPAFGNHGRDGGLLSANYDWKDMLGSQDDTEIVQDSDGKTLYSYIKPNPVHYNDEGELLADYVEAGMPVGFSIGFRVLDYDGDEDEGYEFHETDLLEVSAVGIQSNQQSVAGRGSTDSAAMLAKSAAATDADIDEDTLASALVSELFARAGAPDAAGDGAPIATRDATAETDSIMTDDTDDSDGEYATKQDVAELKETIEEHLGDGATDDGGTDGDDPDDSSGLEKRVAENTDALNELLDAADGAAPEDNETQNRATPGDEDGADGEQDGAAKDTDPTPDGDDTDADESGWN